VVRAQQLGLPIDLSRGRLQGRRTQEALEARLRYLARFLLVDVRLVVAEELILFKCEVCRFECHLESMGGFWRLLDILQVSPVDFLDEVEGVLQPSLLPVNG
jgi:hypothetical protein